MQVNVRAINVELTDKIKNYIQLKADMLEKYFGNIQILNVGFEIELTTKHHLKGEIYRAEMNINVPGELLRVEKTEKELFKAIDKVKDHMALVIKKHKERIIERRRKTK